MSPDYSFARRPRWLVGHVVALTAIVLFANLGLWQLSRHEDRSALDDRLTERLALPPLEFAQALGTLPDELELRLVTASGEFDVTEEVVLQARTLNGISGHNVVTPLRLDSGDVVLVNRGWIPIDTEGPPVVAAPPPRGTTEVLGIVRPTEVRGSFGPLDPTEGELARISRVDLDRLQPQISGQLAPFYLQLVEPDAPDELPLALPEPEPGGGPPHLSYAVQWFVFAGVVAIGYPILLRSTSRKAA